MDITVDITVIISFRLSICVMEIIMEFEKSPKFGKRETNIGIQEHNSILEFLLQSMAMTYSLLPNQC